MQLGENIYRYRTEKGLSQGALADILEVSRQSVSKWENNFSTPELDKLIKMSTLFQISLDELVYGPDHSLIKKEEAHPVASVPLSARILVGGAMLLFGMIFFLLSIFWGDQLRFGEEIGELISLSIVLISIVLMATYHRGVMLICMIIYALYAITCVGILHVTSIANYIFLYLTSFVILIWFLAWGLHASKEETKATSHK